MEKGVPEFLTFGIALLVLPSILHELVPDKLIQFFILVPSIILIYTALKREERNDMEVS